MEIESFFKKILDDRKIIHSVMAKDIKVNRATIANLYRGAIPTLPVAYKIGDYLNMNVEEIWVKKKN